MMLEVGDYVSISDTEDPHGGMIGGVIQVTDYVMVYVFGADQCVIYRASSLWKMTADEMIKMFDKCIQREVDRTDRNFTVSERLWSSRGHTNGN